MKFILEGEELTEASQPLHAKFFDAEFAIVAFMTDRKTMKKLIPTPLKPAEMPIATAFIARYPRTNFGSVYNEAAVFFNVQYAGEEGSYCLMMHVTEDMALILGRELFGYPKKIAEEISLDVTSDGLKGKCVRRGVEVISISMDFEREVDLQELLKTLSSFRPNAPVPEKWDVTNFLFKFFPAANGSGFEYKPKLVKQTTTLEAISKIKLTSKFELTLKSSNRDFIGDIPVKNPIFGCYGVYNTIMHPGTVIAEVDEVQLMPYAFSKVDFFTEQRELKPEARLPS